MCIYIYINVILYSSSSRLWELFLSNSSGTTDAFTATRSTASTTTLGDVDVGSCWDVRSPPVWPSKEG